MIQTRRLRLFPSGKDLKRRVMVPCAPLDDRIREAAGVFVDVHQQLTHDGAVGKSHKPRVSLEPCVHHEFTSQARMHSAHIAHRVPDVLWRRVNDQFSANGSHGADSFKVRAHPRGRPSRVLRSSTAQG